MPKSTGPIDLPSGVQDPATTITRREVVISASHPIPTQWRIQGQNQDFPAGRQLIIWSNFPGNCMKQRQEHQTIVTNVTL